MRSLRVVVRRAGGQTYLTPVDGPEEPDVVYATMHELAPGVWFESLTNLRWPG